MAGRWCVRVVAVVATAAAVWATVAATAAASAGAQSGGFDDAAEDAYYSVPVAALAEAGVFAGTECAQGFCPGDPIDRKTMAVWVVRVLDGAEPAAVTESRFDDVDAAGFHAPFIERMAEHGVTTGCGDGTGFCPDRNVTRAEMAVFLTRAFGLPVDADPGFPDVPGDAWYVAAVSSLVASDITHGCGDGTNFCPDDDTTRAQMATFLHRALNPASPDPQQVVRVLYVVPADREFRSDYSQAIRRATEHVRWWYQQQLDGLTFSLASPVPEKCRMTQPHDFYVRWAWQRVLDGVQHCAPVGYGSTEFVWAIWADVDTACKPDGSKGTWEEGYDQFGRGNAGLLMFGALDLEGVTDPKEFFYCDEGPLYTSHGRAAGGFAHELGHALGLPHPPGCDDGMPSCDHYSLMHLGYVAYPSTYLRDDDDKATLRDSPFITPHDPLIQPPDLPCPTVAGPGSTISGSVVGPQGQTFGPVWIGASPQGAGDLTWAGTCHDGTFAMSVPDGSYVLDVYAASDGGCVGWYDGEGGVTDAFSEAVRIDVTGQDTSGIAIRLPAPPQDLPSRQC